MDTTVPVKSLLMLFSHVPALVTNAGGFGRSMSH